MIRSIAAGIAELAGASLIVGAGWMIYEPLGLFVAGVAVLVASLSIGSKS